MILGKALPVKHAFAATKTVDAVQCIKGIGVIPAYWIEPTIEDLLYGVDTERNFALKLLDKNCPYFTGEGIPCTTFLDVRVGRDSELPHGTLVQFRRFRASSSRNARTDSE